MRAIVQRLQQRGLSAASASRFSAQCATVGPRPMPLPSTTLGLAYSSRMPCAVLRISPQPLSLSILHTNSTESQIHGSRSILHTCSTVRQAHARRSILHTYSTVSPLHGRSILHTYSTVSQAHRRGSDLHTSSSLSHAQVWVWRQSMHSRTGWSTGANGLRYRSVSFGDQGDNPISKGQAVRVEFSAKLDDGSEVAHAVKSFKVGSGAVCAAIEEGVIGMRVGDRRKLRAPPYFTRGPLVAHAPSNAIIQYDILVTGAVHHMQIITLEERDSDDPVRAMLSFCQRLVDKLTGKPQKKLDPNRRRLP